MTFGAGSISDCTLLHYTGLDRKSALDAWKPPESMRSQAMPRFGDLKFASTAAAIFAFVLVVWGAIVRINNAGMTCPDWPRCQGVWFPALSGSVFYEWAHRALAPVLTVLIVATFVLAYKHRRQLSESMRFAWLALAMVVAQIIIGALTIKYANSPASVAAHLVVGIGTFISLLLVAYAAWLGPDETTTAARKPAVRPIFGALALLTTIVAVVAIIAGGYMSASHASLACTGFPLCNGWAGATTIAAHLHMAHRIPAYLTIVLVITLAALCRNAKELPADFRNLVWIACSLAVVQGVLGVLTVKSGLMPLLRSIHQANGVLLVATLALMTYRSYLGRVTQAEGPGAAAVARGAEPPASGVWSVAKNYIQLTKPNVMSLLLFTTFAAMMMAAGGFPSLTLTFWTLLGGALAAASSASINMYWDRDLDAQMSRTRLRPIPSGRVPARHALLFGLVLGVLAFAVLWTAVNALAAVLSAIGILYYVIIYTMWLKRTTPQNIVIGGAAGSIPPLVGWAAVTHHLDLTAYLLFLIVFVWTPPHFWSLALLKKDEYARVGLPMLPAVYGDAVTKRQIVAYSLVLVGLTMVMVPLHLMGLPYLLMAGVLDALFLAGALWVAKAGSKRSEGMMYRFSMLYLALLFSAMVIDRFGHGGS
ncbi:MAG: heme o synthase [Candidatus Eremiobacteraeota bacterium]|nr:heme o synthase [Candidatus Eremiobacteraeota bacterium]